MAHSCRLHFLSVSFGRSNFSLNFPTFQCLMAISLAGGNASAPHVYASMCVFGGGVLAVQDTLATPLNIKMPLPFYFPPS